MTEQQHPILYASGTCPHSRMVEAFLNRHQITVERHSIDDDPDARGEVMALNNGYASVPTLVFPNGRVLTEPSLGQLRQALGIQSNSPWARLRRWLSGS